MDFYTVAFILVAFIGIITIGAVAVLQNEAYSQILEKDPLGSIPVDGNATTLGEIDVAIDPTDSFLPPNGTLSIDTIGANDIDIQSMPQAGQTILISNTTATVTENPVNIGSPSSLSPNNNDAAVEESCDDDEC